MKKLSKKQLSNIHGREKSPEKDAPCSICLENAVDTTASPCRHAFCEMCIRTWLSRKNTCPICRKRVKQLNCPTQKIKLKKDKNNLEPPRIPSYQPSLQPMPMMSYPNPSYNGIWPPFIPPNSFYFNFNTFPQATYYGLNYQMPPPPSYYYNNMINNFRNMNTLPPQ